MKLVATPSTPEFLSMSEEEQVFLRGIAEEIVGLLESAEAAMAARWAAVKLDQEEQLALWTILPARVRTAIKRVNAPPAVECAECGLTGAHARNCPIGGRFA
jgi:hypothetical protein